MSGVNMEPEGVSMVFGTTITCRSVSTAKQLRTYIQRDLIIEDGSNHTTEYYHSKFKLMAKHELDYINLMENANLGTFCRISEVRTSVILESDLPFRVMKTLLDSMECGGNDYHRTIKFMATLHMSTSAKKKSNGALLEKFNFPDLREKVADLFFDQTINKARKRQDLKVCQQFDNTEAQTILAKLRKTFTSPPADRLCVIHGNLRPDNLLIYEAQTGCISTGVLAYGGELSLVGDCAYDLGTLIGSLLIHHYIHMMNPVENDRRRQFCYDLQEALMKMIDDYNKSWGRNSSPLISATAGYAGMEIMFRLMGDTWASNVDVNDNLKPDLISCAVRLITAQNRIVSGSQLVNIALMLL